MNSYRQKKIINSALWAAAGDAIGWISELTDTAGLNRRINDSYLLKPVGWKRKIGGYSGVNVDLPAGTYSDDTQLRLAVSRCIRNNGEFDIESFAKIELPVWLSYALGAGRASKASAANLMRKDVTWFSNFYTTSNSQYINSGGNGTAMRIQPHVWSSKDLVKRLYTKSVIMDSLVTHGHMLAACGAILHADTLQFAIINSRAPDLIELEKLIDNFSSIPEVINQNYQLKNFWLPSWEEFSEKNITDEVSSIIKETKAYLYKINTANKKISDNTEKYINAIKHLECDKESRRGTGTNTALASSLLCYYFSDSSPYEAIITCINQLGTDTDSIATMAGAVLGCYNDMPQWDIQDNDYIVREATRLNSIAQGLKTHNFEYPNINRWIPPQTQSDTLVKDENGALAVMGLGKASVFNEKSWNTKNHSWKWMLLDYGQTILLKSKVDYVRKIDNDTFNSLYKNNKINTEEVKDNEFLQKTFNYDFLENHDNHHPDIDTTQEKNKTHINNSIDLDKITSEIIKNGFNEEDIGRYLISITRQKGLDSCIAFSAIIGKAYLARQKK